MGDGGDNDNDDDDDSSSGGGGGDGEIINSLNSSINSSNLVSDGVGDDDVIPNE